jgi:hypothetical protein
MNQNQIIKKEAYDIHIILTNPNTMLNLNLTYESTYEMHQIIVKEIQLEM